MRSALWLSLGGLIFAVVGSAARGECPRSRQAIYRPAVVEVVQHRRDVVLVPKAVAVQVSPDYYFSVADYYRDKLLVDAIAGKTLELMQLQQQMEQLRKELRLNNKLPDGKGCDCPPKPDKPPEQAGIDPKLATAVANNCLKCHGGNAAALGGGLDLSDLAAMNEGLRWKAHGLVNSGEMPKSGKPLSDEEVRLFYEWAKTKPAARSK